MKTIIILSIIATLFAGCQENGQTQRETLEQISSAKAALQAMFARLAPQAQAVVENVVKPAVDQIKIGSKPPVTASAVAEPKSPRIQGLNYTNVTNCYEMPNTNHNVVCYAD